MAAAALSASSFVAPTRVRVARRPAVQARGCVRATAIGCPKAPPVAAASRAPCASRPERLRFPRDATVAPARPGCWRISECACSRVSHAPAALSPLPPLPPFRSARMLVRADGGFIGSSTNLVSLFDRAPCC